MFHTFSATPHEPTAEDAASRNSTSSPSSPASGTTGHARQRSRIANRDGGGAQIQQTLTVCTRCRQRKIKCDPGLPRCSPCEKASAQCEYFDVTKQAIISRKYVIWLQHKIRELEVELSRLEVEDQEIDSELAVRNPGLVRLRESEEMKFLGPSSGIAISRVVMNLAKQFSDSKSIKEIISEKKRDAIEVKFAEEEAKAVPEQPPIPMYSEAPAVNLPSKELTFQLVQLFFSKVHAMYPILHEPSFLIDVEQVYSGSTNPCQNFCLRMVVAVGLQRMDKQYAGLADAYFLAALKFLEDVIRLKSLETLQAYALIAAFSLMTPTRTAIYYVIGAAVRLAEALGFLDERTINRGPHGTIVDPLQLDMRRRLAWSVIVMDFGLAHSLGRPSAMAVNADDIKLGFFQDIDDQYITSQGILPAPACSVKKWISIHFFKMRLLQLEIRKGLYLKKRPEPSDDSHPWFVQMEKRLEEWRDASPREDGQTGMDKIWFTGRYYTMVIFLNRPSPQISKPSSKSAVKCCDACRYNIHMAREQIKRRNVETTWIFTQAIFMAINTLLWSLSYEEVRKRNPREEIKSYLDVGLESIMLASERWPGAASAHELYVSLIDAVLKIYDKDGDVHVNSGSLSSSPESMRPQSTPRDPAGSPAGSIEPIRIRGGTPSSPAEGTNLMEQTSAISLTPQAQAYGFYQTQGFPSTQPASMFKANPMIEQSLSTNTPINPVLATSTTLQPSMAINPTSAPSTSPTALRSSPLHSFNIPTSATGQLLVQQAAVKRDTSRSPVGEENLHYFYPQQPPTQPSSFDPNSSFNQLPTTFSGLADWSPNFGLSSSIAPSFLPIASYDRNSGAQIPPQSSSAAPFDLSLAYTSEGSTPTSATSMQRPPLTVPLQQHDVYPDPYWVPGMLVQGIGAGFDSASFASSGAAAMMGSGLPVEGQAGLMQTLEQAGPDAIGQMLRESEMFFQGGREVR